MNSPPDAVLGSAADSRKSAPNTMPTRPFYWSVRRELWESRSVIVAPLVVAALVLFASLISVVVQSQSVRALPSFEGASPEVVSLKAFKMAPAPIMLAVLLIGASFSLDALYGERRDRSILFWKSLPVSDLTTVLSKASIPLVVLPFIGWILSVVTQFSLLVLGTMILWGSGVSAADVWAEVRFFEGLIIMFYGLAAHVLWFSPIYAWILLISAWAKRMPVLWVVLPPLAVGALEHIAFGSSALASFLWYRVAGAMEEAFVAEARDGNVSRLAQLDPAGFLTTPGLWLGLGATAAFLVMAARLRRDREPI